MYTKKNWRNEIIVKNNYQDFRKSKQKKNFRIEYQEIIGNKILDNISE